MDFTIIRGDNRDLAIALTREGAAYTIASDDELIFTAKASTADTDANAKFQKIRTGGITTSGSTATVAILHADTKSLTDVSLVWDIQVRTAAGVVFTGASGWLFLTHDSTREVNASVPINTTNPISSIATLNTRIDELAASDINDDSEIAAGTIAEALNSLLTDVDNIRSSLRPIIVSSNTTATLNRVHHVVATATIADPSPVEGQGFDVFVINGTATVGSTAFSTAGTIIKRVFHSGSWVNRRYLPS